MPLLTPGEQEGSPPRSSSCLVPVSGAVLLLGACLLSACSGGSTPCSTDTDCGGNDTCVSGLCSAADGGQQDDGGFTAQACTGIPSLVVGGVVGPTTEPTACVTTGRLSAAPAAQVTDLGTYIVGTKIPFTLPTQTFSFSLVSQAVSATESLSLWETLADGGTGAVPLANNVFPDQVTNPDGVNWWDYTSANEVADGDEIDSLPIYNPISPDAPVISVLRVPNTTAMLQATATDGGLPKGQWSFVLQDYASICRSTAGCDGGTGADRYDVQLITRTAGVPLQGTLNIDMYLLTTDGITHSTAPSNAFVQRMVNTLAALYAPTGVCIGTVTFYDLPAWAKDRFGTAINIDDTSPCSDISQLYTLAVPGRNTVPIFLVDQLTSSETNGTVLGKDGTIPGPASYNGTIASGSVVTAADLTSSNCQGGRNFATCGADRVGYYAAHEIGHFLGLYHTTEQFGTVFDPLSDTPECQCLKCAANTGLCASSSTVVVPSQCSNVSEGSVCSGATDLMFWSIDPGRALGSLTSQQGTIARLSPVIE